MLRVYFTNKKLLSVLENEKIEQLNLFVVYALDKKNNIEYFNGKLEGSIAESYAGEGWIWLRSKSYCKRK